MENAIRSHLQNIFEVLIQHQKLVIPSKDICLKWDKILQDWVKDERMTLFVRKGSESRGTRVTLPEERTVITTDNTPAHWVFKKIALSPFDLDAEALHELITANEFPIAFIRKRSEYESLVGNMVATKEIRLNEAGWKLAHIDRIAMKRGAVTINDYKAHHFSFLSLSNMYLIDKRYSGIAEVTEFNNIVKEAIFKQFKLERDDRL